jgi:S1-C subfamily serine protease
MHRTFVSVFLTAVLLAVVMAVLDRCQEEPNSATFVERMNNVTVQLVDDEGDVYCTGVWVSLHYVLTARHCGTAGNLDLVVRLNQGIDAASEVVGMRNRVSTYREFKEGRVGQHSADVVAVDGRGDLALLWVHDVLTHDIVGPSTRSPTAGNSVFSVGHTMGLLWSYSPGTVSFARRSTVMDPTLQFQPYLQLVSAVGRGSSGAGVFDADGDLVGVVSFLSLEAPMMSFAVPLPEIRSFLRRAFHRDRDSSIHLLGQKAHGPSDRQRLPDAAADDVSEHDR